MWPATDQPLTDEERLERRLGNGPLDVDQTTFRSTRNKQNNYMLDRQVQKHETFTGIDGINLQDRAVQESMGAIVDRSKEIDAMRSVQKGHAPRGVGPSYRTVRRAQPPSRRANGAFSHITSATPVRLSPAIHPEATGNVNSSESRG